MIIHLIQRIKIWLAVLWVLSLKSIYLITNYLTIPYNLLEINDTFNSLLAIMFNNELFDGLLDTIILCNFPNSWSLGSILLKHRIDQHLDLWVKMFGKGIRFLLTDQVDETWDIVVIKRLFEGRNFIQSTTQSPNIGFLVVNFTSTHFWWHEIGGTTIGFSKITLSTKSLWDTKITKLDNIIFCQEHILSLDVSMQNILWMHKHNTHNQLSSPIQNLRKKLMLLRRMPYINRLMKG